jgi:autotransporter-associated beta strand protein
LTLSGSNTLTEFLVVNQSKTLNLNSSYALGNGRLNANNIVVLDNTSGTAVTLQNNNVTVNNTFSFAGSNPLSFGSGTFSASGASRTLTVTSSTLTIGSLNTSGASPTTYAWTKAGAGTLAITGAAGSNFQAGFTLSAGTLQVGNDTALGTGAVALGANTLQAITQDVTLANNFTWTNGATFSGSQSLTLNGNGSIGQSTKTLNNNIAASKTLTFGGNFDVNSVVASGTATLTLAGSGNTTFTTGTILQTSTAAQAITVTNTGTTRFQGVVATAGAFSQNGAGTVILSGTMSGPSGYRIENASANFEQTSTGVISGTGAFTLANGNATLSGSNSYLGTTSVSNGVLKLNSANALPSSGALSIGTGGVLGLGSDNSTFTRAIGSGTGQVTWTGGGFAAYGSDATVNIGGAGASINAAAFSVWSASTADRTVELVNPYNLSTSAKVVTVNNGSADVDARFSGGVAGSTSSYTKNGAGTLELTAANTYSGTVAITAGQLRFSGTGSLTGTTGPVVVNGSDAQLKWNSSVALTRRLTVTQGTISGTGSISATGGVSIGTNAVLSPGNSPGTQAFTTGLTLAPGGTYVWEVNSGTGTTGTNWDLINVTGGGLNLASLSGAGQFNLDLSTLTASGSSGSMDNYTPGGSYTWRIFDANALTLPGLFGSSPYTPGTDITSLFNVLTANWKNTVPAANDISVKVAENGTGIDLVVVPEPGTIALGVIGIGLAGFATWRRRRR